MKKKVFLPILITIIFSLPAILPLLHPGFFATDDGEWMIIRLSAFYTAFADGQFPVRFLERLNFGYGYPVAEFLYPGSMYLGSVLHVFKIGFVDIIKIILALSLVGSGVFTYLWLSKIFNKTASFIGALVYLYLPYHLYDVYTRGSVGEVFALLWVPFILWNIERKNLFFTSCGIALLILSHNTLGLLFLPLLILIMAFNVVIVKEKKSLLSIYSLSTILGIGLSAFFWMPAIFELHNTVFSKTAVANWREYFASMYMVGYATLFILLTTALHMIVKKIPIAKHRLTLLFFIIGLFSLFLASPLSSPVWYISPAGFVQFPFRLLSVVILCVAFLAAANVSVLKGWYKKIFISISVVFLIFSTFQHITSVTYFDKGEGYYTTNDATTTVKDEYMPVWVKAKPTHRAEKKVEVVKGEAEVSNIVSDNKKITFSADVKKETITQLNTIYWPGWKATVDGKEVQIAYKNQNGLLSVSIPPGTHQVKFSFVETLVRLFADSIAFLSLVIILFLYSRKRRQ